MAPYTPTTTADEVASGLAGSIKNNTVLITGVSPWGLGAEFAITIAKHFPALLILANRNLAKAQKTAQDIATVAPSVPIRILQLDLNSQAQVRKSAEEVNSYKEHIDVLVNNAGIMAGPYQLTEDGIDSQFGINHIGHFLFTNLILNKLVNGIGNKPARVINVSSDGYRLGPVRFDDWNFDNGKTYDQWRAYGQSKSANMLFSVSLAEKLAKKGLISVSLHPGAIMETNLANPLVEEGFQTLVDLDRAQGNRKHWDGFTFKTLAEGTATHVFAAFDDSITPSQNNGAYLIDSRVERPGDVRCWGRDLIEAERLWKLSEQIVGQKFEY